MHDGGIFIRTLKPENIFLIQDYIGLMKKRGNVVADIDEYNSLPLTTKKDVLIKASEIRNILNYQESIFLRNIGERVIGSRKLTDSEEYNLRIILNKIFYHGYCFDILKREWIRQSNLIPRQDYIEMLKRLIEKGESEDIEFKSSLIWDLKEKRPNKKDRPKDVIRTIAAFLNRRGGGKVLVGISDDGTVCGINMDFRVFRHDKNPRDEWERFLDDKISHYLGNNAFAFIRKKFITLDNDKIVCLIEVDFSYTEPIFFEDEKSSIFYIRRGNSTVKLNAKEQYKYIKAVWKEETTRIPIPNVLKNEKNDTERIYFLIERFVQRYKKSTPKTSLPGETIGDDVDIESIHRLIDEEKFEDLLKVIEDLPSNLKQTKKFLYMKIKALVLMLCGRIKESNEFISDALAIHGDDSDLLALKAFALSIIGEENIALSYIEHALKEDPSNPFALYVKSLTLYEMYRETLDRPYILRERIEKKLFKVYLRESLGCINKAIDLDSSEGTIVPFLRLKGRILFELGRYKKALKTFEKVLKIDENDPISWYYKGSILEYIANERPYHEEAMKCFDKALELGIDDEEMLYEIGISYHWSGQYDKALKCLERVIEISPESMVAFLAKEAIEDIKKEIRGNVNL